ncbi:DUF4282 domain-containing protein [Blastopirellula sp. JC732]|uniref:DUF4282 domain-containing protein n=1 Tax=Blastopirellula sediminis TaxID=2894196 RepID=A0A9X1MMS1_9BACT|nr:DUF4282 domain-containing protein [Blastopirellula sediminis]MCC9607261.1 DUF4282 domain-containing protein [Blastopirellula sediminis]MCC9629446.1 DUF4282 domain-containing protein [Blastopirellula sediminis]
MAEEFYLKANENAPETGPFSSKKMRQLAAAGQITPETLVRRGESSWVHASSVRGLELPSGPPPVAAPPVAAAPTTPAAGEVPMGIPVTPTDEVTSSIPTTADDDHGISLPSRLPDPTGSTGEAQFPSLGDEPRAFDEDTPTPPSITAPPPPPPAPPAAVAVAVEPKSEEPEISEMISVAPNEKGAGKGKKKKGKGRAARAASGSSSSGGGLGGLFSFKTMIAPSVIKIVYYLGLALIVLGWLGISGVIFVAGMANEGLMAAVGGAVAFFFVGGIIALLKILGLRIGAEAVIAYFQAVEDLAAIRSQSEEKD